MPFEPDFSEDLWEQFERMTQDPEFAGSRRATELLRYLLEQAEKGGESLKVSTIANDFYKDPSPSRENAANGLLRAIRRKLHVFYTTGVGGTDPKSNPIIIRIVGANASCTRRTGPANSDLEDFFGDGAGNSDMQGAIVLQADLVEKFWDGSPGTPTSIGGEHRAFKARRWVNVCDLEGAQELLCKLPVTIPRLVFSYRGQEDQLPRQLSFEIALGGFTDRTQVAVKRIGNGWMRLVMREDSGSTLYLHKELVSADHRHLNVCPDDGESPLVCIRPLDWDANYMPLWLDRVTKTDVEVVRDYAFILRHTEDITTGGAQRQRRVHFYLAGFTEISTAAAGFYLANRWHALWKEYVKGKAHSGSRGDFLVLIEGPSDHTTATTTLWTKVNDVDVTPEKLAEAGIKSVWVNRLEEDQ